jgi:acetyltransferase-like isoleucine patch superfamily enzyme
LPFIKVKFLFHSIVGYAYLNLIKNKGERCIFEGGGDLHHSDKITIGSDVYLGKNFFLQGEGSIFIGNYTHISRNVVIHTSNHNYNGDSLPYDKTKLLKTVKVGNYVWVGMNVLILPGVTIGDGAVIGMGSVVSKDVPQNTIFTGSGGVFRGSRDLEQVAFLLKKQKFLKNI